MATAWRVWRIKVDEAVSETGLEWREIELRIAGTDQTSPVTSADEGKITANQSFSNTLIPSNLVDNNTSTGWASLFDEVWPKWVQYDFGAGNEKSIDQIAITPAIVNRAPRDFEVQVSQDGATFYSAGVFTGLTTGWAATTQRLFTVTPPEMVPADTPENPVIESVTALKQEAATTIVLNKPSGLANGDLLVVIVGAGETTTDISAPSNTTPWIEQTEAEFDDAHGAIYTKLVTDAASEPSTYSFALGVSIPAIAAIYRISNVDQFTPVAGVANFGSASNATSHTLPPVLFSAPGALLLGFDIGAWGGASKTVTVPPTMTSDFYETHATVNDAHLSLAGAHKFMSVAGSSGRRTFVSSLSADYATIALVINPTTETPPAIGSIVPTTGPTTGGTSVIINGVGFTDATGVLFGTDPATSFLVVSDLVITCDTPAHAAALVDVTVEHPDGDLIAEDAFIFTDTDAETFITQAALLLVHNPNQPLHITQAPLLVVNLPIQGAKLTQSPILPVWTPTPIPFPSPVVPDVPLIETWTWRTVVSVSENANEQRSRLREVPRIGMSFSAAILDDAERRLAFDLLFKAQRQAFAYPLYQYSAAVTVSAAAGATALAFDATAVDARAGELLAIYDPALTVTHFVECSALASGGATVAPLPVAVPAGWFVCGVASFRTDPVVGLDMNAIDGSVSLVMVSTTSRDFQNPFSLAAVTTYDGFMVLADRPLADDSVEERFSQNVEWLDNEIGTPEPVTNWLVPYVSGERQYLARRPEGLHKWRAIADHLKGRQNNFLLPTFRDDFPLTEVPTLGATVIKTSRVQFFDYWRNAGYHYLRIATANGPIYRRIVEVVAKYDADGQPVELWVKLNTALGGTTGDNIITVVSMMLTCRLDDDTITLTHGEIDTVVSLQIKGVTV